MPFGRGGLNAFSRPPCSLIPRRLSPFVYKIVGTKRDRRNTLESVAGNVEVDDARAGQLVTHISLAPPNNSESVLVDGNAKVLILSQINSCISFSNDDRGIFTLTSTQGCPTHALPVGRTPWIHVDCNKVP